MTRIISVLLACAFALTSLSACGFSPIGEQDTPAGVSEDGEPSPSTAENEPQISPLSEIHELVLEQDIAMVIPERDELGGYDELGELSFKLFGQTESAKSLKNSVFSPISAAIALGMLSAGANGETANELESLIGWNKTTSSMMFGSLMCEYADISLLTDTALNLANAAFFSPSLKNPKDDAIMCLRDAYMAKMFCGELSTDSAREFINGWVSDKTEGEIPAVLDENLDDSAVLVLINTILLDAKWANPFINYGYEQKMEFTCANGGTAELPCLSDIRYISYIDTDELTGATLDYSDNRLKFMAVKPKDGDISGLIESLDYSKFVSMIESAEEGSCIFSMPKFSIESETDLNECVKELGAKLIFDQDNADLSGFGESDSGNVFVSKIFQKAKVDVDEDGTRAAAATVEVAVGSCAIAEIKEIKLDSGFFWCVYDGDTNVPLFMGTFTGEE